MNCVRHTQDPREAWEGFLCKSCFYRMRADINELVFAAGWLRSGMLKLPQWDTERVGGSKEPPAPLRVTFLDQAVQIEGLLRKIENDLFGKWSSSVEVSSQRILLKSVDLAGHPSITHIMTALHNVKERAHKLSPWRRSHIKLPVPCPTCNLLTLTLYQGDSWVTCRNKECVEVAMPFYRYDKWINSLMTIHGERIEQLKSQSVRGARSARIENQISVRSYH